MMDQKYLAEIKARCDEGRPTARIDVKALIAEVERLTDLSRQNYCKFVRQQEECAAKDQQIATLKKANAEWDIIHTADGVEKDTLEKALELMIDRIHKPRTAEEAKDIFRYWIQETREQLTRESTHECDKSAVEQAQKQEGKK